jgi:hypothetical protein
MIGSIKGQVPVSGLVAYYPFNGNGNDESGNGHNGSIYGATLVADRNGVPYAAYGFNGVGGYISVANDAALNPPAVTVVAWAKVNAFSSTKSGGNTTQQYIVFKQNVGPSNFEGYSVGLSEPTRNFGVMVAKGNGGVQRGVGSAVGSIELNRWYQIALVADSTQIMMYLDGVFQGNVQTGFPLNYATRPLYFGRSGDNGFDGYFNGGIDNIRIYNRTLRAGEIDTLYRVEMPYTTAVDEMPGNPVCFELSQNYPNPFNPSTTMRYGLASRSHVVLTVFNTLGQKVAVLQDGEQEVGYHEVQFDGSNLSSGVYFYRMHAGAYVATRKMVLMR